MTFNSGSRVLSSNLKQPFSVYAAASGSLTVTTATVTDITGATVTFSTVTSSAVVEVTGVFDISVNSTAASLAQGWCNIDTVQQTALAVKQLVTVGLRDTVTQQWRATLTGSSSHTIKLQGNNNAAAGSATFNASNTTILVRVYDF